MIDETRPMATRCRSPTWMAMAISPSIIVGPCRRRAEAQPRVATPVRPDGEPAHAPLLRSTPATIHQHQHALRNVRRLRAQWRLPSMSADFGRSTPIGARAQDDSVPSMFGNTSALLPVTDVLSAVAVPTMVMPPPAVGTSGTTPPR